MKFEHFALNVPDARAHAEWYVAHFGMTVTRRGEGAPHMHFLADETGRTIVELYSNPKAEIPDHAAAHPLCFHMALVSADAAADSARLSAAGATEELVETLADGSVLIMMRDPWGVPIQLCQRAAPFPMP